MIELLKGIFNGTRSFLRNTEEENLMRQSLYNTTSPITSLSAGFKFTDKGTVAELFLAGDIYFPINGSLFSHVLLLLENSLEGVLKTEVKTRNFM